MTVKMLTDGVVEPGRVEWKNERRGGESGWRGEGE